MVCRVLSNWSFWLASPHGPTACISISVLQCFRVYRRVAKSFAANSSFSSDHYVLLLWPAPNRTQLHSPQTLFVYMPVGVLVCIPCYSIFIWSLCVCVFKKHVHMWILVSAWVYQCAGLSEQASVFAYPPSSLGVSFHVMLLNSNQVPLSRGTPAAGRNKHNEFFSIVAVLWAPLNYRDVEWLSIAAACPPEGRCTRKYSQASINLGGKMRRD